MNVLLFTDELGHTSTPDLAFFVGAHAHGNTVTADTANTRTAASSESEIAAAVAAANADVCVLAVGTNDGAGDAETVAKQIRKTAKNGKSSTTSVVICTPLGANRSGVAAWLNRLNNNPSYTIVDLADPFFSKGFDANKGPDGWPDENGAHLIAQAIAAAI